MTGWCSSGGTRRSSPRTPRPLPLSRRPLPEAQDSRDNMTSRSSWIRVLLLGTLLGTCLPGVDAQPSIVRIGGLVDSEETLRAFKMAAEYVNQQQIISPRTRMEVLVNSTRVIDSFTNIQMACEYAGQGVMAFVGPLSSTTTRAVAPLAEAMKLPQVAPVATNPQLGLKDNFPYLVRMSPPDSVQSRALVALVESFGWTRVAILTSNTDYGINGLVEFQGQAAVRSWRVVSVQQFSATNNPSDVNVTSQLTIIANTGVRVVLLNCLAAFGKVVLEQASDLGMTGAGWAWVVTDGITGSDDTFGYPLPVPGRVLGLLGTRPSIRKTSERYRYFNDLWRHNSSAGEDITMYAGYWIDAVLAVAYGLRELVTAHPGVTGPGPAMNCESPGKGWEHGDRLLQYITQVKQEGAAANIAFNDDATPLYPVYDILNLKETGWTKLGEWTPSSGLDLPKRNDLTFMGGQRSVSDYVSTLTNRTIVLVTKDEEPFVMLNESRKHCKTDASGPGCRNLIPNEDVYGYCIDLLLKLSDVIGFDFRLYYVDDDSFGIKGSDRQWNGMIKEVVHRRADIAVADLTINVQRENDCDFTAPYLDLGMTILMKIPDEESVSPWRFTEPFTAELWGSIIGTCFLVALVISLLNKSSPYDHHGGFVYIDNQHLEDENFKAFRQFKRLKLAAISEMNFPNATWFSVASLLQQGGEVYPKSLSGRVTALLWWAAIVIIVATYTANLAAWLTASRTSTAINSLDDLYSQTKVMYGTVANSAVEQYFRDSSLPTLESMYEFMRNRDTLAQNTDAALKKVREESFAFIWDSSVLEYKQEQRPCDTVNTVGKLFGKIGYGFALQKNSPYKDELSEHILQLREAGFMDELKRKWYEERAECASDSDDSDSAAAQQIAEAGGQLQITHLLGVYYIVYGGLILSFAILILEWIAACTGSVDKDDPLRPDTFCEAFRRRMRCLWDDIKYDWLSCPLAPPPEDIETMAEEAHKNTDIEGARQQPAVTLGHLAGMMAVRSAREKTRSAQKLNGSSGDTTKTPGGVVNPAFQQDADWDTKGKGKSMFSAVTSSDSASDSGMLEDLQEPTSSRTSSGHSSAPHAIDDVTVVCGDKVEEGIPEAPPRVESVQTPEVRPTAKERQESWRQGHSRWASGGPVREGTAGGSQRGFTGGVPVSEGTTGSIAREGTTGSTELVVTTGNTEKEGTNGSTVREGTTRSTEREFTNGSTVREGTSGNTEREGTAGITERKNTAGVGADAREITERPSEVWTTYAAEATENTETPVEIFSLISSHGEGGQMRY